MLTELTPMEVHRRLRAGDRLVILDVREPFEIALAALPDAVHIPMGDIPGRLHELDPEAEIVVVCHHGIRSANVANFLASRGFESVINLRGGIDAWSRTVDPGIPVY